MKRSLPIVLSLLCLHSAFAGQCEFALLSFTPDSVSWTDASGLRRDSAQTSADHLFADLSGQSPRLAHSDQARILILNGISKKGWTIMHVTDSPAGPTFLLQRDIGQLPTTQPTSAAPNDASKIPVVITGGHDTDPHDGGRPVILVASALGVSADVFRDAFSNVTPARGGPPEPAQVRRNKEALLEKLGPYGVTNDQLDTVSNYYRYNRSQGEMWRNTPATAVAISRNGTINSITLTNPGSGYSSPPSISIPSMPGVKLSATLSFGADLAANGSIKEITVVPQP